jgi:hypothetical protein
LHVDLFHFFIILEFFFGEVDFGVNGMIFGIGSALFGVAFIGAALFGRGSVVILVQIVVFRSLHHFVHDYVVSMLFRYFFIERIGL